VNWGKARTGWWSWAIGVRLVQVKKKCAKCVYIYI
jgi:hypothetical protein